MYPRTIPTPKIPNPTGPFYEDGSLTVRFEYPTIPHHDPFETPMFLVGVPGEGSFTVGWTVHAANLSRPVEGSLEMEVHYEAPGDQSLTTLVDLFGADEDDADQ